MTDIAPQADPGLSPPPVPSKPSRRPDTAPTPPKTRPPDGDHQYLNYLRNLYLAARKERLKQLREARSDTQAKRTRLLTLVESGAMEATDPELKDRLAQLKLRCSDLDNDIAYPSGEGPVSYRLLLS